MLARGSIKHLNYFNRFDLIQKYALVSLHHCPVVQDGQIELQPRSSQGKWLEEDVVPFLLFFLLLGQIPYLQKIKSKLLRQGRNEKLVVTLPSSLVVNFVYFKFLRGWTDLSKTFYTLKSGPRNVQVYFGPVTADFFFLDSTFTFVKLSKFIALLKYNIVVPLKRARQNARSCYKNCLFFWDLY